jgi:adenine/guanine phosphoribosyltransferase-like PRPP-binding protein
MREEDKMNEGHANNSTQAPTGELLQRVSMLAPSGRPRRSNPLADPPAFEELVSRLAGIVDESYDLIVVRDLFGDKVLGYQLSLKTGRPVAVSYDREGIIDLEGEGSIPRGGRALIVADIHFTKQSIRAAASGIEQAGLEVAGVALLLQITHEEYPFPVRALELRTDDSGASE